MAGNNRPSHRVYAVRDRDNDDAFWTRIGSVFPHQDGKGFNVIFDALPVDGRAVLREVKDEDEPEAPKAKATRSGKKRAA